LDRNIHYPLEPSADPEFKPVMKNIIKKFDVQEIVETGTRIGTGSTLIFAQTKLPVFSIECNAKHVAEAKKNLRGYPNVTILHGYSLKLKTMLKFILEDDIYNRNFNLRREGGRLAQVYYLHEISCSAVPENLLIKLINNSKQQLILLDSSGGAGYLEFKKVMSIKYLKNKILMLDDIKHVKHYRSVKELKKLGIKFHYSRSKRWGWAKFND